MHGKPAICCPDGRLPMFSTQRILINLPGIPGIRPHTGVCSPEKKFWLPQVMGHLSTCCWRIGCISRFPTAYTCVTVRPERISRPNTINAFRDTLDNPYYLGALSKPSPLGDGFDAAYFDRLVAGAKPNLSAKAFLATQQRIPGLGNGVLQDILFNARIHPKRKMATLGERELDALFGAVKSTLAEMTAVGGRDTEKDLFGNSGGYKVVLSKNTYADPCPVCGGALVKEAYLGGAVYYCPHCQPLK